MLLHSGITASLSTETMKSAEELEESIKTMNVPTHYDASSAGYSSSPPTRAPPPGCICPKVSEPVETVPGMVKHNDNCIRKRYIQSIRHTLTPGISNMGTARRHQVNNIAPKTIFLT